MERRAVVRREEYKRVIGDSRLTKCLHNLANLPIEFTQCVAKVSPDACIGELLACELGDMGVLKCKVEEEGGLAIDAGFDESFHSRSVFKD